MHEGMFVLDVGVQADNRVIVDHPASLVLEDLHDPGSDKLTADADPDPRDAGQLPGKVRQEPLPQLRRARVEQHRARVVVAVRAHRTADPRVIGSRIRTGL
jgi:hypothetical protein